MSYNDLTPVLIKAIQEQEAKIEALEDSGRGALFVVAWRLRVILGKDVIGKLAVPMPDLLHAK